MKIQQVFITPQIAEEYLKRNKGNRPLRKSIVDLYARQMKEGQWKEETGESIKFSESGTLLDGQHRLHALIKSGVSLTFTITCDLKEEIYDVIDTGFRRTASDTLHKAGFSYAPLIAAAIRTYKVFNNGLKGPTSMGYSPSAHEVLEFALSRTNIEQEASQANSWGKKFNGLRVSDWLFWLIALGDKSYDDAMLFLDRLSSGVNLQENDPILTLRNKLISLKSEKGNTTSPVIVKAYVIKAWNAFRRRKKLSLVKWRFNEDFPEII